MSRGLLDRFNDLRVARAPAHVPVHEMNDFFPRWFRINAEEGGRRHQHAGRTEPTLQGAVSYKGLLKRSELAAWRKTLDSGHRCSADRPRGHNAGTDGHTVY